MKVAYLLPIVCLLMACNFSSSTQPLNIDGYDWQSMKKVKLQEPLAEISGIVYDPASNSYLAINDEQGNLYVLNATDFTIRKEFSFGKAGDYECVTLGAGYAYVLKSNGDIYTMQYDGRSISNVTQAKYQGHKTEFESTLWDDAKKQLYIISKKSDIDHKLKATQVYAYDPVSNTYSQDAVQSISWQEIKDKGADVKGFHPSAAAIQPATGDIFLVSSIEKLLVILDNSWHVKTVHSLDPKLFQQPEGIAFNDKANLVITNEGAGGRPTVIFIPAKH